MSTGFAYGIAVGLNPYQKRVRRPSDVVFVALAIAAALALLAWAAFPR